MMSAAIAAPVVIPQAPFRGIEFFRYVDQSIFFARKVETQKLLRLITLYRGVLLYGDSGSGKSSAINAGLIPAVMEEGFSAERLRVQPRPGEEIILEKISTTDEGKAPYLPSLLANDDDETARVVFSTKSFMDRITAINQNTGGQTPLLIFDQFEEIVTLFEEAPRGEGEFAEALKAQDSILETLIALMRDPQLRVKLLLVFREDYLAKLSKLFVMCPDLPDHYLRLVAPNVDSLPDIIRGPFERFPGHFGNELSPELTATLTTAINALSNSNKINLSEVQIACLKLWQSDDPDLLFKEKGVHGLLADYLSDSLKRLPVDLQDAAVALLSRMVTPSGTRNIVSEYDLISQVKKEDGLPEDKLKAALQALLKDSKLIRRERRHDAHFYEIVSEFLIPWIMGKKADREADVSRRELQMAEGVKRRRAYRLSVASIAIAVAMVLAAFLIIRNRTVTVLAQEEVQNAREEVDVAIESKARAEKDRDEYRVQAEASKRTAVEQKHSFDQTLAALKVSQAEEIKKLELNLQSLRDEDAKQARDWKKERVELEKARDEERRRKEQAQEEELTRRRELVILRRKCGTNSPR